MLQKVALAHRSDLDPWRPSPGVDRCHHESLQRDSKNAADTDPIPLEVNVCKTVKVTCTWLDIVLGAFSLNHGIGTPGTFDTRSQGIGPRKSGNSVAAHRRWEGVCSNSLSLSLSEVFGAVIRKRHLIRGAFLRALVQDQRHRKHTGPHEIQSMRLSPLGMFRQSPDIGGFGAPPFGTSGLGHTGT